MKTYLDYVDEPDIIKEPIAMREIHAIRLLIQDEIKDMTPMQRADRTRNAVLEAEKRHGVKFHRTGDSPANSIHSI